MQISPIRTNYHFKGIITQEFINKIDNDACELLDKHNFQDFDKLMNLYKQIQQSTNSININVQEKSKNENSKFKIDFTYNAQAGKTLQGKSAASPIFVEIEQNKKFPAMINILSIISKEIERIQRNFL